VELHEQTGALQARQDSQVLLVYRIAYWRSPAASRGGWAAYAASSQPTSSCWRSGAGAASDVAANAAWDVVSHVASHVAASGAADVV